jgi:hypothetical protein
VIFGLMLLGAGSVYAIPLALLVTAQLAILLAPSVRRHVWAE